MFMDVILPLVMLVVFLGVPMTPLFIAWRQVMREFDNKGGADND